MSSSSSLFRQSFPVCSPLCFFDQTDTRFFLFSTPPAFVFCQKASCGLGLKLYTYFFLFFLRNGPFFSCFSVFVGSKSRSQNTGRGIRIFFFVFFVPFFQRDTKIHKHIESAGNSGMTKKGFFVFLLLLCASENTINAITP